jgi:hypothetical protein
MISVALGTGTGRTSRWYLGREEFKKLIKQVEASHSLASLLKRVYPLRGEALTPRGAHTCLEKHGGVNKWSSPLRAPMGQLTLVVFQSRRKYVLFQNALGYS